MKRKDISSKRLELRPYKMSDYKSWLKTYTQSLPKQYKYDQDPYSPDQCSKQTFKSIVSRHNDLAKKDSTYVWAIYEKKSGNKIGTVDIHIICRDVLQVANLGYRVSNLYWKKGFGKEAVRLAIKLAFTTLGLNRLEAVIDPDNKPSIKLAKSVEMINEGIRKKYYYQNNSWDDQIVFSAQRELSGFKKLRLPLKS